MKISTRLLSIGLVGCVAAAFLVYRFSKEPAPEPPVAPPPTASSAEAPKTPAGRPETEKGEIAALKQEITRIDSQLWSLRQEIFSLKSDIKKNAQAAEGGSLAEGRKKEPVDPAQQREKAAKARQAKLDALESSFRSESEDPGWSSATLAMLQTNVNNDEALRASTHHIECRSKTCRVEISDAGSNGKVSDSIVALMKQVSQTLPAISASRIDEGDGSSSMVIFMSREGAPQ